MELQRVPAVGGTSEYKLSCNGVTQFRRSRLSGVEFITYDRINGYANSALDIPRPMFNRAIIIRFERKPGCYATERTL